MREAPRARVLVATPGLAQAGPARLRPTRHTTVPLATVAAAAQQHLSPAQRTPEHPPAAPLGTHRPGSRHRPLRSEPQSASGVAVLKRGRDPSVGAILCPHCASHGGARRFEQLSGRLGRRARSRIPGQRRSTAQPAARASTGAASLASSPTSKRCSAPHFLADHRRRLVHGGGRASPTTNARPPRWASRVQRAGLTSAASMPPNQPAIDHRPRPADPSSLGQF